MSIGGEVNVEIMMELQNDYEFVNNCTLIIYVYNLLRGQKWIKNCQKGLSEAQNC